MNKTRQWTLLTALACLAILAAGFFLVVKPQRAHAKELRTQAASVRTSNAQLQAQVSQLRQQQKDLPAQQKLLSQIATKIPDNPALPALIRQLSAAADGAGVDLVSMAPAPPTIAQTAAVAAPAVATSAAKTTTTAPHAAAASPLAVIQLTLQVKGSYFNVEQFFAALENLNRGMLVTGFALSSSSPAASGGAAGTTGAATSTPNMLSAQITAQVFESPQLAAAPSPATSASTTTTGH